MLGAASAKSARGCEELRAVVLEGKHDHAVEVDFLKSHRRNESQDCRIDFSTGRFLPCIKRALQTARVVRHHEIRAERQAVRQAISQSLRQDHTTDRRSEVELIKIIDAHEAIVDRVCAQAPRGCGRCDVLSL